MEIINSYNELLKNNNNFNNIFTKNRLNVNLTSTKFKNNTKIFTVNGASTNSKLKNKKFIIKKTKLLNDKNQIDYHNKNSSNNECIIYKYIRNLVKYNICPFIYYGLECKIEGNYNVLVVNTFQGEDTKLKTLEEILNLLIVSSEHLKRLDLQEFYIILFQIMYTLKCFNLVGIKHNDLHLGNILVEINPKYNENNTKLNTNVYEYNRYVIDETTFNIPICKYTVKIYDFDFSIKYKRDDYNLSNNKTFKECFEDNKTENFKDINFQEIYGKESYLNQIDNINFDLLKLLFIIYNELQTALNLLLKTSHNKKVSNTIIFIQDILTFINTLFDDQKPNFSNLYLDKDKDKDKDYNKKDYDINYNFNKMSLFLNYIKSIDDILLLISQKIFLKLDTEIKVYNTNNLYIKSITNTTNKSGGSKIYNKQTINKYKTKKIIKIKNNKLKTKNNKKCNK